MRRILAGQLVRERCQWVVVLDITDQLAVVTYPGIVVAVLVVRKASAIARVNALNNKSIICAALCEGIVTTTRPA